MRRTQLGKIHPALAVLLVVATLAASAGAGIYYQYLNGKKLDLFEEPEPEEEVAEDKKGGGLSMPPIGPGVASNTRPERTTPFKYVYSDIAPTCSDSGAAKPNPAYSSTSLSEEEFKTGFRDFMLKGVEVFRSANSVKDEKVIDQAATLLTEVINVGPDGDLKPFRERLAPMLLDPTVARDPFFQYVAGTILVQNDEEPAAGLLFNGSIVDHQKWDYPSCYVVTSFNARLKNGLDLNINREGYKRHADALVGWLQYDFSEEADEQCFSWAILNDSIELLAKNGQLDQIKKVIDKNSEQKFVSPWLAEMMLAHYHLQLATANQEVKKNLDKSKQHLETAIKINPAFTAAKTDLESVEGQLAALKTE